MKDQIRLSIVSPVYRAEPIVPELVKRIHSAIVPLNINYEIILIDDRSPDGSWDAIKDICHNDIKVKGVRLSRNYGQHYALTAGLQKASGDFIVVMDCDLQDDPLYIPVMLEKALSGNDIIFTYKKRRAHSIFKNVTAWLYFKTLNLIKKENGSIYIGAFSLISRKARNAFLRYTDVHRHYLPILQSIGFKSEFLEIEHRERFAGSTSYSLPKLIKHALDGIVSQSLTLLYASIIVGFSFFMLSLLGIAYYLYMYLTRNVAPGYTSLAIFILLSTGLILISIGILGIYVGKIFDQVRARPMYLIDEELN